PQSDIYAVGVTLYEMLTGHIPFESETAVGLAYKHITEMPTRPGLLNPNIPARLDTIVMKALAKEPSQRFNSAAEMEKALRNLEANGQQATAAIPVARTNVTASATRQRRSAPAQAGRSAGRQTTGARTTSPVTTEGPRGAYA